MKKLYKELTPEQINEGVIFSSCLSTQRTEQTGDTIHEVKKDDNDKSKVIERLLNDSFFNESPYKFNIVRQ